MENFTIKKKTTNLFAIINFFKFKVRKSLNCMGKRKFAKSIIYITLYPRSTPLDIFDVMKTLTPLTHTPNKGQHCDKYKRFNVYKQQAMQ